MASSVYEGLTVGYCLALTQFLMVFVLGILYLRKADREYDPLAAARRSPRPATTAASPAVTPRAASRGARPARRPGGPSDDRASRRSTSRRS